VIAALSLMLALSCPALAGEMPFPAAAGETPYEATGNMQNPAASHIEIGAGVEMGSGAAGGMDNGVSLTGAVLALLRVVLMLP